MRKITLALALLATTMTIQAAPDAPAKKVAYDLAYFGTTTTEVQSICVNAYAEMARQNLARAKASQGEEAITAMMSFKRYQRLANNPSLCEKAM